MSKPKVAIFDFACCEGCQLQIVNMEEEILDLLSVVDVVEWREAMSETSEEFDIALVEGSITRPEDEVRIKMIREKATVLIALGACATIGGVNKLKNLFPLDDVKQYVYGSHGRMAHLQTGLTKSVGEVVQVDYTVHGCPIDRSELGSIIRALVAGKEPIVPNYPVCVECKLKENVCRYEYNEVCLGPVTRAGCGARCPASGFWCFGCRGLVDDPNVNAARDVMKEYGKTMEDLKHRMVLFNSDQEQVHG